MGIKMVTGKELLRPISLEQFCGQAELKHRLKIYIDMAKQRNDMLDHCLFYAPPGLGKTTIAGIIANEMGCSLARTQGSEADASLIKDYVTAHKKCIIFIDEIHKMPPKIQESFYPLLEDFKDSDGNYISKFTMIAATTDAGKLLTPFRDRFGIIETIDFYEIEDLIYIIKRSASILGIEIDDSAAEDIAKRSRGTPRIANRLLKRSKDFAQSDASEIITQKHVQDMAALTGIDMDGAEKIDRKVLKAMYKIFGCRPVGLGTLAKAVFENEETIRTIVEPFLLRNEYIELTNNGRVITTKGRKKIGESFLSSEMRDGLNKELNHSIDIKKQSSMPIDKIGIDNAEILSNKGKVSADLKRNKDHRRPPRVSFVDLVRKNIISVGEFLYSPPRFDKKAEVLADGNLYYEGKVGSIRTIGMYVSGYVTCDSWFFWYILRDEKFLLINNLRIKYWAGQEHKNIEEKV
jgi:Holliday junction DNA helicase RuvB